MADDAADLFTIDATPDPIPRKRPRERPAESSASAARAAAAERALAKAVFGGGVGSGEGEVEERSEGEEEEEEEEEEGKEEEEGEEEEEAAEERVARAAAWIDADDEAQVVAVGSGPRRLRKLRASRAEASLGGAEYVQRLRAQFASVQPDTAWAALPARQHTRLGGEEDEAEGVLRDAAPLLGKARALPHDVLSLRRVSDLNAEEPSHSVVPVVQWHPNAQLALTAGPDQTLRLFRVDGTANHKVQSVHATKMPIASAAFTADGSQVLMCGASKNWGVFDLHSASLQWLPGVMGRHDRAIKLIVPSPDGSCLAMLTESNALLLLSAKTKQLIATLQGATAGKWSNQCLTFSNDGEYLHAASIGSKLQVWDVRRRCCVHSWNDRGGTRVTAIDASSDGQLLAVGSDSGAVNLYRAAEVHRAERPPPVKEFLNLRSAITCVRFNPSSEMVVFSTKYTKNALRVAHVARQQVFANWPTSKTPLNYVQTSAFSPHSGFMATGNDKGKVLLHRLNHFEQA